MPAEYLAPGVYVEEVANRARPIEGVATATAAFVDTFRRGPLQRAIGVTSWAEFERHFGGRWQKSPASSAVEAFFANGGRGAWIVRVKGGRDGRAGARALLGRAAMQTGLHALTPATPFNLLCLPRVAELSVRQAQAVYAAAVACCAARRALLLIDVPASVKTLSALRLWTERNAPLHHANAAVFYPRVTLRRRGRLQRVAASGAIAGLYARHDARRGVWKAAAGIEAPLAVAGVTRALSRIDLESLSLLGVNGLRAEPRRGVLCWGARTFLVAGPAISDWKYLPVRRTALYIEESIVRGTQWVVFEPNAAPLWQNLRRAVEDFLYQLWRSGAFVGDKPEAAFFARCDRSTMTQNDIDHGRLVMLVGFAPVRPAEFIVLRISQQTAAP
jgi:hypothetical protein